MLNLLWICGKIYVIFNSSWDKGCIISNAGKVTTDKHLMGEGNRRSLCSKKLVDPSSHIASESVITACVGIRMYLSQCFICIIRSCGLLASPPPTLLKFICDWKGILLHEPPVKEKYKT